MPASNTEECFREFIGQKAIGVIFGVLRPGLGDYTAVMVFEDGRGLGFYSTGAFGVVLAKDVQSAMEHRMKELEKTQAEQQHIVDLAGKLPNAERKKSGKKRPAAI